MVEAWDKTHLCIIVMQIRGTKEVGKLVDPFLVEHDLAENEQNEMSPELDHPLFKE